MIVKVLFKILFLLVLIQIKTVFASEYIPQWFVDEESGSMQKCLTMVDVQGILASLGQEYFPIIEDPGMIFSRSLDGAEPFRWQFLSDEDMLDISREVMIGDKRVRFHCNIHPNSDYTLRTFELLDDGTCRCR
jgi:hypothetical protein